MMVVRMMMMMVMVVVVVVVVVVDYGDRAVRRKCFRIDLSD